MNDINLRDTFGDFLVENGSKYPNLVVLDADLSLSTRTYKFKQKFPERFFNMGIAEQNMMGVALGFAISGKLPIISGFSIFTTGRAWEFIRLACHDNLNLKIITTHGGFVGKDGSTHHALEDLSLMSALNNLTVLVPSDNIELKSILEVALNTEGPFYIRLPRGSFPTIHSENYQFKLDRLDVIKEGQDLCLIGSGYGSVFSVNHVKKLEKELGISIKIINLSQIKPINKALLQKEIQHMKGAIVIEEHNTYVGVGAIVSQALSEKSPLPLRFIGIYDSYGQSGDREKLLDYYGLNYQNLLTQIKNLM